MRLQRLLQRGKVAEFFRETDASLFIGQVTLRKGGRLDIASVARNLNVSLEYDTEHEDKGAYDPGTEEWWPRITINPLKARNDMELTFGHEVGHYFMDEVLDMGELFVETPHEPIAEAFCELFGHMMARTAGECLISAEQRAKDYFKIPDDYEVAMFRQQFGIA